MTLIGWKVHYGIKRGYDEGDLIFSVGTLLHGCDQVISLSLSLSLSLALFTGEYP